MVRKCYNGYMRLRIKATSLELTPALRVQVRRKIFMPVRRVLAEPDSAPTLMDVELARTDAHHHTGRIWRCEVTVTLAGRTLPLRAEATTESIEEAIIRARGRIERAVKKSFERSRARQRKGGRKVRRTLSDK